MKVQAHPHLNKIKWGHARNISVKSEDHLDYYSAVILGDVTFKISEAGRQRALRDKKRNVHAWAVGELLVGNIYPVDKERMVHTWSGKGYEQIVYNPFRGATFQRKDGQMVTNAKTVVMFADQCWAKGINY